MVKEAPTIDGRTAVDIAAEVRQLLPHYLPEWPVDDQHEAQVGPFAAALIAVFARYAELIIERLNRVPEKNQLAFFDLLGASLLPPQPARVPLTFSLSAGNAVEGVVPPRTQVAAQLAEGEKSPAVFETERELTVTASQLQAAFTREPDEDRYGAHPLLLDPEASPEASVFRGESPIIHEFYIGHDVLLGHPSLQSLSIDYNQQFLPSDSHTLEWTWNEKVEDAVLTVANSTTRLAERVTFQFKNSGSPIFPLQKIGATEGRWLRCRLLTPINGGEAHRDGMVRAAHLPLISNIALTAEAGRKGFGPEQAFTNLSPLDLEKSFFPFGEKPKFNDAFYLAHGEAFASPDTSVDIHISLLNPTGGMTSDPLPVAPSADLELCWEFWDGKGWRTLLRTTPSKGLTTPTPNGESKKTADSTRAMSSNGAGEKGTVSFTFPAAPAPQPKSVAGIESYWVRARILKGNYGQEARFNPKETSPGGVEYIQATLAPPVISSLTMDYSLTLRDVPQRISRRNDFILEPVTNPGGEFAPFRPTEDSRPSFYLGFEPPSKKTFPNRAVSIYFYSREVPYGTKADHPAPEPPRLSWQYWNGSAWVKLAVLDETENLTRPGPVEFLAPPDFTRRAEFGEERFWIRTIWESGHFRFLPRLQKILLNTVVAAQTVSAAHELLGSSNGNENQNFHTARKPVLDGQVLEVREGELPPARELQRLREEEHEREMVAVVPDAAGNPKEIWVRWHPVPDFHGSGPRDRHYVLDRQSGEVRFGNGTNGMIPPRGKGSIRMRLYRTGGGSGGNKPARSVTRLMTTVPYVDKVVNHLPAEGGAEGEEIRSLLARAPRELRHGHRAVTREDYEDLAMLASPEVARAKCVPLCDLETDPYGKETLPSETPRDPGTLSVIIVPRAKAAKPLPSLELVRRVKEYLERRGAATAAISVVGPLYLRVDVSVEIAVATPEGAGAAEEGVRSKLAAFLHPLTGGTDGTGWTFGRAPHQSDLYALLESVPGVDHIRSLEVAMKHPENWKEITETGRYLVYSGDHKIDLVFPGARN